MKNLFLLPIVIISQTIANVSFAKIDLVTLPTRDTVQLTIYNSADLTLARENRNLTFYEGPNRLEFSWANTLIDPTSLELFPLKNADKLNVASLTFPPRIQNSGIWKINSEFNGESSIEINYLTSGLSWRAFYMGTLSENEESMHLKGYVRVENNSGEDYENAQVRLVVGKVNLLDQIAELAQRQHPYGRPGTVLPAAQYHAEEAAEIRRFKGDAMMAFSMATADVAAPKAIVKEGLSEYFLYTIEGQETIPHGWSKRLPSFDAEDIPVKNLYKYNEQQYGTAVMRFLNFNNDKEHKLGETPIPGGNFIAYRSLAGKGDLSFEGESNFQYIPVEEAVELNLGPTENVIIEPKIMQQKTLNYEFNDKGNITGWDAVQTVQFTVKNTRDIPIKTEITRTFNTSNWELKQSGDFGDYEKVDLRTVKFTLELKPQERKTFEYALTSFQGTRAD